MSTRLMSQLALGFALVAIIASVTPLTYVSPNTQDHNTVEWGEITDLPASITVVQPVSIAPPQQSSAPRAIPKRQPILAAAPQASLTISPSIPKISQSRKITYRGHEEVVNIGEPREVDADYNTQQLTYEQPLLIGDYKPVD